MARVWKDCATVKPTDEQQILLAMPDKDNVVAGHWFAPEQAWVLVGTHIQVWPSMWRNMPKHPFAD